MAKNTDEFGLYTVRLPHRERNGMHILAARMNMGFDQIVTLALSSMCKRELSGRERGGMDDDEFCNHIIGEYVNSNCGGWGYDSELNDIPDDKRLLLVETDYDV